MCVMKLFQKPATKYKQLLSETEEAAEDRTELVFVFDSDRKREIKQKESKE